MRKIPIGRRILLVYLWTSTLFTARLMATCPPPTCTKDCIDPAAYVSIQELSATGSLYEVCRSYTDVDPTSVLEVHFNQAMMALPNGDTERVKVAVEVSLLKNGKETRVAVQNYVSTVEPPVGGSTTTSTDAKGQVSGDNKKEDNPEAKAKAAAATDDKAKAAAPDSERTALILRFHDKPYRPPFATIPDTSIDLRQIGAAGQDEIIVRVVNLITQEEAVYRFTPRDLGWHTKTTDSVMFVQRQGVSKQDVASGVVKVNFAPTPGVTYGGIYTPRSQGLLRILSPGIGINVSFLNWNDPTAFDNSTGQFVKGTTSSNINIGLGIQASLFNGILQATYGWNLQADKKRSYFGLGVSFINIAQRITSLTASH